jgi:glucokinase
VQSRREFAAVASVDNDENLAAIGEYLFGAGKGRDSILYVSVSLGIGGGWIPSGNIFRGADARAG